MDGQVENSMSPASLDWGKKIMNYLHILCKYNYLHENYVIQVATFNFT